MLRPEPEITGRLERADEGGVDDDTRRFGVAHDVQLGVGGHQAGEKRFGLRRRAIRWVAQVQRRRRLAGNHVVGDARVQLCDGYDLAELEAADGSRPRLAGEDGGEAAQCQLDRILRQPRPRRMSTRTAKRQARDDVSEAAGLDLEIRRLEHDRESGLLNGVRALEQRRERIVLGRKLLPSEEHESEVAARPIRVERARELEGYRKTSLHVGRPEPVDGAISNPSGEISLRRNRVVVRHEKDQWPSHTTRREGEVCLVARELHRPSGGHEREEAVADCGFASALGGDVDELERPRSEPVGERGHQRSVPRHNHAVTARQPDPAPGAEPERGFLLAVYPKGTDGADELAELTELARTAGVEPIGSLVQHRAHADPRTFVGKGKLAELEEAFGASGADVLLADDELTPTQQRTLEDALKTRVVDRTQLILDIFAQHARSAEGKLQVELAQLEYNLPRMRGLWQHLERLGGGVGTRGPGESQLETDRRLARTRVSLLKRRLRELGGQRSTRRKERLRTSSPTIALAGYTNVGKSTLLNALTGAHASVDDRLFETLDPTTRGFEHDGKRYLVTDTVGFIRRLPTQLVEGFAATLEETLVADLVLHVADASLPEERLTETIAAVETVLADIGADDIPIELVLNKVDLLDSLGRRRVEHAYPRALLISAEAGEGLDALRARIADLFSDRFEDVRLLVPYSDGKTLTALYDLGAPIAERRDTAEGVRIRARLPHAEAARFARYLVAGEQELDRASAR